MILSDRVRPLGTWLEGTGITLLELTTAEGTIRLQRGYDETAPDLTIVNSPAVGVFHHVHPLRPDTLVQPGDPVQAGAPVGLLRVGMLLLTVAAPVDGIVQDHRAEDGATVGYGTPLLRLVRNETA